VQPLKPEPEPCLTCKGTGRDDASSQEPTWSCTVLTATDLASKQNDSQAENPTLNESKGLLAAGVWFHTQCLGTGGSP
jgi:hypothetical protein